MTYRIEKSFSKWRAGFVSCEQCCTSAYNMLLKKDKEIEELNREIECLKMSEDSKRQLND